MPCTPVLCAADLEMPLTRSLITARARFEAARSLPASGDSRLSRRHGHGFVVDVTAHLAAAATRHPIEPVGYLTAQLEQAVAALDYADLDTVLEDPSDLGIARYLGARLEGMDVSRIVVAPTPFLRMEWEAEGRQISARRYTFEAAHYLPNVPAGHKCGRLHGHSFEVLVRARGTGAGALDAAWREIGAWLTDTCLNDIEGLSNPTSECLSAWLWQQLRRELPTLCSVTVYETGRCGATFDGERYAIWRAFTFDAAVQRPADTEGLAAARVLGHTYRLRLHLSAPLDAVLGWATDFGDVQRLFAPIYDLLDHRAIGDLEGLADQTTESIADWIRSRAAAVLPSLCRVDLEETAGNGVVLSFGPTETFLV